MGRGWGLIGVGWVDWVRIDRGRGMRALLRVGEAWLLFFSFVHGDVHVIVDHRNIGVTKVMECWVLFGVQTHKG